MKNFLCILTLAFIAVSCNNDRPSKDEIKYSQQNIENAAGILTKFPSEYAGTIGAADHDSVRISLKLLGDQSYSFSKEFYKGAVKDTTDYENGNWSLEGENILVTQSKDKMTGFDKFKIVNENQLRLVDSLGNEMTDGKKYDLMRVE